jgi:hypothetical protein
MRAESTSSKRGKGDKQWPWPGQSPHCEACPIQSIVLRLSTLYYGRCEQRSGHEEHAKEHASGTCQRAYALPVARKVSMMLSIQSPLSPRHGLPPICTAIVSRLYAHISSQSSGPTLRSKSYLSALCSQPR